MLLLLLSDDLGSRKQPLSPSLHPPGCSLQGTGKTKTSEFMSAAPMGGCAVCLNVQFVISPSVFPNVLPTTTALTNRQRMSHSTCTDCMRRWGSPGQFEYYHSVPASYAL